MPEADYNDDFLEDYNREAVKLGQQWLEDNKELLDSFKTSEETHLETIESLFNAADYAPVSPFEPSPNAHSQTVAERNEMMGLNASHSRGWDSALEIADNFEKTVKVEEKYAKAELTQAKTRNLRKLIFNESLRGLQIEQSGRLISEKTEGLLIATQRQEIQNGYNRQLVETEVQKGMALLQAAATEIDQIRAQTESKISKLQGDYLKGAGVDGSYEMPENL
jgi:hypothetical protein